MSDTVFFLKISNSAAALDGQLPDPSDTLIQGESTAWGLEKLIEVEGFDWSLSVGQAATRGSTATDSRKATAEQKEFSFKKFYDVSSEALAMAVQSTEVFTSMLLTQVVFEEQGGDDDDPTTGGGGEQPPLVALQIELQQARVKSVSLRTGGSGKGVAVTEEVKVSYENLRIVYFPPANFDPSGNADPGTVRYGTRKAGSPVTIKSGLKQATASTN